MLKYLRIKYLSWKLKKLKNKSYRPRLTCDLVLIKTSNDRDWIENYDRKSPEYEFSKQYKNPEKALKILKKLIKLKEFQIEIK